MGRRRFTGAENEKMRLLFPEMKTNELADMLGRTYSSVQNNAVRLGLKKSEKFLREVQQETRFQKGLTPHNAGKKLEEWMSPEYISAHKRNSFKSGQVSPSTRALGDERVDRDGYVSVKVKDDPLNAKKNWVLKHRLVYEQNFGPIPEGMIVEFADGDKRNFDPANLVLKTRRQNVLDNSLRDSAIVKRQLKVKEPARVQEYIEQYPELIEMVRAGLKVNRKVNELTGKNKRGAQL